MRPTYFTIAKQVLLLGNCYNQAPLNWQH